MKRISMFAFVLAATLLASGLVYGQCSKSKSQCGSGCGVEAKAGPKPASAPQEAKKSETCEKTACQDKTQCGDKSKCDKSKCDAKSSCAKGCGCSAKTAPKPTSVPQQAAQSKKAQCQKGCGCSAKTAPKPKSVPQQAAQCEKGCGCSTKASAKSGACPVTGKKGEACPVANAEKCPATGKTEGQCPEVLRKAAAVMPPCAECKEAGKSSACEACAQKALVQARKAEAKSGSCVIAVDHSACTGNAASCLTAAARGNQSVCPVDGKPINKDVYLEHQGKRIYFSCTSCLKPFKKNAARYIEAAEAKGVRFAVAPASMKNVKVECTKCNSALVNGKVTRIAPKSAPTPDSSKKASEKAKACCGSCGGDCSSEKKSGSSCESSKSSCSSGSCGGK